MSNEIKVFDNIPMPRRARQVGRASQYPFATLGVGECFFVPGKTSKSIGSAVNAAKKRTGNRYSVVTLTAEQANEVFHLETPEAGVGVWRIALETDTTAV